MVGMDVNRHRNISCNLSSTLHSRKPPAEEAERTERSYASGRTMLVIDKKMLPMKDANLPKQVLESTPKRYQKAKLPIVKAKIGPQIINLICDDGIFDVMPVRGEVKAMVSGIYITSVKNVRGKKAPEPAKKSFSQKLRAKQKKYEQTYEQETASMKLSKEEKAARKAKAKEEKERAKKIQ